MPAEPAAKTSHPPVDSTGPRAARLLIRGVLGLVSLGVFLGSSLLLLLALALAPRPGNDLMLSIVQLTDVVGWLAIGIWLLVEWGRFRLRVIVPPIAAWLWTSVMTGLANGLGLINMGGP